MADKNNSVPAKPKKNLAMHLIAGGVAGCCEAVACHPLDTIKVRLQLRGERQIRTKVSSVIGEAIKTAPEVKPKRQNFVSKYIHLVPIN
jgi:solute carrier family 25 (mitochondrial citrate transporter), member 1